MFYNNYYRYPSIVSHLHYTRSAFFLISSIVFHIVFRSFILNSVHFFIFNNILCPRNSLQAPRFKFFLSFRFQYHPFNLHPFCPLTQNNYVTFYQGGGEEFISFYYHIIGYEYSTRDDLLPDVPILLPALGFG